MAATPKLDALRADDPRRADYAERLMRDVREWAYDPYYFRAAVATYAVRRILQTNDPEFEVLVEAFGELTERDWAKAQEMYGPDNRFPGLKEA